MYVMHVLVGFPIGYPTALHVQVSCMVTRVGVLLECDNGTSPYLQLLQVCVFELLAAPAKLTPSLPNAAADEVVLRVGEASFHGRRGRGRAVAAW